MTTGVEAETAWEREDSAFLQVLAYVLTNQNREQAAVDLLEYALAQDPENGDLMRALCGVYSLLERYDDAIVMGDAALSTGQRSDDVTRIKLIQSSAHHALGRAAEAEQALRDYITHGDLS